VSLSPPFYNTLNQLTDAGLLRQVSVDGTKNLFRHQRCRRINHFYLEKQSRNWSTFRIRHLMLQKIAGCAWTATRSPAIDMVVRLRKKALTLSSRP